MKKITIGILEKYVWPTLRESLKVIANYDNRVEVVIIDIDRGDLESFVEKHPDGCLVYSNDIWYRDEGETLSTLISRVENRVEVRANSHLDVRLNTIRKIYLCCTSCCDNKTYNTYTFGEKIGPEILKELIAKKVGS